MAGKAQFQTQPDAPPEPGFGTGGSAEFGIEDFEARLQELEERLQNLDIAWRPVWTKGRSFDSGLDLRLKVDAVRWMLRVAKHLNGAARDQIILAVGNSLDQLEKAVDVKGHAA